MAAMTVPEQIPDQFRDIAGSAMAAVASDPRLLGLMLGGSFATGTGDAWSDLDLVIVSTDETHAAVLADARAFADRLGPVLVAFTGEHVGEPRLLIALYGPPPLHVDLKFIGLGDLDHRVEDGIVLWQRDDVLDAALRRADAVWPAPEPQWIEDRFWVWVHYATVKIARGELLEAVDAVTYVRSAALAPLASAGRTERPAGVRRLETLAPEHADAFRATVAGSGRDDCLRALLATIELYRRLREDVTVRHNTAAEDAVLDFMRAVT